MWVGHKPSVLVWNVLVYKFQTVFQFFSLGREEYPNFVRTIPPHTKMAGFVTEICKRFGWTRITLVVSGEQEALLTAAAIEVLSCLLLFWIFVNFP